MGLTVPKLARMATQSQVLRAAQTLQAEVQQAYAIAGRNRVPVRLRWVSTDMQIQVTSLAGTIYRRRGVGGGSFGLVSANVSVIPATLTVFPNGLANDSLVIAVSRSGFSRTVRVTRSGLVRSQ